MGIAPVQVQVLSSAVIADKVIGNDDLFLFYNRRKSFGQKKSNALARDTDAFYTFEKIFIFLKKSVDKSFWVGYYSQAH